MMMGGKVSSLETAYKNELNRYLELSDCEKIFLYWKGRVALYALLRAIDIKPDDEVILPAYTCVVVPNAILYLRARPVYVDIDTSTFNPTADRVESAITDKTRAVICQNTYGLSSDIDKIVDIAKTNELITIEDCTHGFGGQYEGQPNGRNCDAAFYSTQWNKPFSTGIGGFAISDNPEIISSLNALEPMKCLPSNMEKFGLAMLLLGHKVLLSSSTQKILTTIYRKLASSGLLIGSSSNDELETIMMPEDYFKGQSEVQMRAGLRKVKRLRVVLAERKNTATRISETLIALGKRHVSPELHRNHSYLYYPVLVRDREKFLKQAERRRVAVNDWFNSPLHPIQGDLARWGMDRSMYPNANYCSEHVINLPTSGVKPEKIVQLIEMSSNNLI